MHDVSFLLIFGLTGIALFVAGFIGKLFKIPMLLLYIFAGVIVSELLPLGSNIAIFGEIGIVILFFFLGLEFNLSKVLNIAKKVWIGGVLDIAFNFLLIFLVLSLFGFNFIVSFTLAGVAYASSSAITTKIIIDEHRMANSETEFILGLMVFEDMVAPIIIAFATAFSVGAMPNISLTFWILFKIFLVIISAILFSFLIKKKLSSFIDKYLQDEILTIMVIGFVIFASGVTKELGLSEALGAFLVGIIVAESGKSYQVESLIVPIRDITVSYFFLIFGSSIHFIFPNFTQFLWPLIAIVILSILGKILTGIIGGRIFGLSKRKSLIAGLGIVNRGEFSIAISQHMSLAIAPIASLYILILAVIGIATSYFSNKIAKLFYKKKGKL
ncbi:MAG: hypothetical protein A2X64_09670 [Ignavibacteria bacterium GWF2_33_9]|nr:MAG: hypothetical protein A2X64_09670 [Ignavibacteria bacterium GWF2_33_9]